MKGKISVSVVIPVLNGEETIGKTLDALSRQVGVDKNTEIIVVDNGSTDKTCEVVARYKVTLLHESTRGPSAARNRGLKAARGEVIVHLDADTVPTHRWLHELTSVFCDPLVLIAGGRVIGFPPETSAERFMAAYGMWEPENNIFRPIFPFVPSLNMAVRREAALAIGGWSENMLTGEDVDFSYRLQQRYHTTIAYCPNAILFHRHRATDNAMIKQAWTYGEGGAQMYMRYPDQVEWTIKKSIHVLKLLVVRSFAPLVYRLKGSPGKTIEFSRYYRLWSLNWWLGFFSMYIRKERRTW